MISSVAEMYGIHPQTLRLYEREGLLKPSRTEGNTRLYTDEDLQRLEFILSLARDLGVNIAAWQSSCKCASAWRRCSARSRNSCSTSSRKCLPVPTPRLTRPRARLCRCGDRWWPVRRKTVASRPDPKFPLHTLLISRLRRHDALLRRFLKSASLAFRMTTLKMNCILMLLSSSSIATRIIFQSAHTSSRRRSIAAFMIAYWQRAWLKRKISLSLSPRPMKTFCWSTRTSMSAS